MSANAPAVNAVTLVGNLTADPVLRTIDEHRKVCEMRLAVNDHKDQPPLFSDIATFGSQAEACAKHLTKGRAIAVTGRLIYREWVADDGTRRSKHAIVGHIQFGGRPAEDDHTNDHEASFGPRHRARAVRRRCSPRWHQRTRAHSIPSPDPRANGR
jgi:single-strand DNA-binding protein